MTRFAAWASVVALLLAGIAIGALTMHLYHEHQEGAFPGPFAPGGPGGPGAITRELEEALALTPDQRERIREIREEGRRKGRQIREEVRPLLEEHIEKTREEISEVLTPEQREVFDEWWRANRHRRHRYFLGDGRGPRRGPRFRSPGPPPPEPPPPPE